MDTFTAVQMGGALADQLTGIFRLNKEDRRILLMAGIAAGFASVFGTPLAGAVFALEVLAIGRLRYDALLACSLAAIIGDQTTTLWGVHHTHYTISSLPAITAWGLTATLIAGAVFGIVGMLFANGAHWFGDTMKRLVPYAPLRPVLGGVAIAAALWLFGAWRYAGLGIPVIVEAFEQPLSPIDFVGKMVFTIASLGSGFKGGEVTPLFYIGATLGNALAPLLNMPFPLLAAIGFVGVFAGAANTPLACTLMAMELFGPGIGVYALLACVMSYRAVFAVAIIPAVLAVALLVFGVKEPSTPVEHRKVNPISREQLKLLPRAYWHIVVIGGVFTLARFSEAFLVLKAQQVGVAVALVPLVMVGMNVVYAGAAYPFGWLSDRMSHHKLLAMGLLTLLLADVALASAQSWPMLFVGVALWGVHLAMTQGLLATMVADVAPTNLRGTAFGVFNLVSGVVMLLASVFAGVMWDIWGASFTFIFGAIFCAVTLLILAILKPWSSKTAI